MLQLDLINHLGSHRTRPNIREIEMTASRFALALAAALAATSNLAAPSLVTPSLVTPCLAQDYPKKPIRIIEAFDASDPADVTTRQSVTILQEKAGEPIVIENRPAAGGVMGAVEAAKSPPDGYTLLMMSNTQTANESLM